MSKWVSFFSVFVCAVFLTTACTKPDKDDPPKDDDETTESDQQPGADGGTTAGGTVSTGPKAGVNMELLAKMSYSLSVAKSALPGQNKVFVSIAGTDKSAILGAGECVLLSKEQVGGLTIAKNTDRTKVIFCSNSQAVPNVKVCTTGESGTGNFEFQNSNIPAVATTYLPDEQDCKEVSSAPKQQEGAPAAAGQPAATGGQQQQPAAGGGDGQQAAPSS